MENIKPIPLITLEIEDILENEALKDYFDDSFMLNDTTFKIIAKRLTDSLMNDYWLYLESAIESTKDFINK